MNNKLDWNDFSELFHPSWHKKMKPAIESKWMWDIFQVLKSRKHERTFPTGASGQLFRAFKETSYDNIHVIFVGSSPYHMMIKGKQVADGLSFSCGNTRELQPSLRVLYEALEDDLREEVVHEPDLTYWANQGVLLLNASLTVKERKPDSDLELWKPFTDYLFTEVLDTISGVPIILFGEAAKKAVERHLFPMIHPYRVVKHPSFYARNQQLMEHGKLFTWCNTLIGQNTGVDNQILWDKTLYEIGRLPF